MAHTNSKTAKTMKNKIIAIIPARGGSKGLPRKNIKLLAEKSEDSLRKRVGRMYRRHCGTIFILEEDVNIEVMTND